MHLVDIENAISYAFKQEIALHKVIKGEKLEALKRFLEALLHSLPLRPPVYKAIDLLHKYVLSNPEFVDGAEFTNQINAVSSGPDCFISEQRPWIGCSGSKPQFRGYPCSLWTTFHTLTVNAYLRHGKDVSYRAFDTLSAIHGYVKYFFSCENCSLHFQEMFNLDAREKTKKPGDELMWLWEGHNKVNKRLKGTMTEDPNYPKLQFPPTEICPFCTSNNNFIRNKVFNFLTKFYSENALSKKGLYQWSGIVGNSLQPPIISQDRNNPPKNHIRFRPPLEFSNNSERILGEASKKLPIFDIKKSWGFNTTDVSLCVALYFMSTLLIVSGYFMFSLKRRMRRRKYIQQLA